MNESETNPNEPEPTDESVQDETVEFTSEITADESDAEPDDLETQLAKAIEERDKNADLLLRSKAELDNVRRRMLKELDEQHKYKPIPLVGDLLPGIDNLQRAIDASQNADNVDDLVQGVSMVLKQFEDVLAKHGITKIEAVGQPFDPNFHEAIQNMPSDEIPAMNIIDEAETGYVLHDRVVRPSKVLVSSGPAQ